jgi:hypothetical protein
MFFLKRNRWVGQENVSPTIPKMLSTWAPVYAFYFFQISYSTQIYFYISLNCCINKNSKQEMSTIAVLIAGIQLHSYKIVAPY